MGPPATAKVRSTIRLFRQPTRRTRERHNSGNCSHELLLLCCSVCLLISSRLRCRYNDLFDLAAAAIGLRGASNVLVAGCGGGQELVSFSAIFPDKTKGAALLLGVCHACLPPSAGWRVSVAHSTPSTLLHVTTRHDDDRRQARDRGR